MQNSRGCARVSRARAFGEDPKMPWFTRAIPLDFTPWVFLARIARRCAKNYEDLTTQLHDWHTASQRHPTFAPSKHHNTHIERHQHHEPYNFCHSFYSASQHRKIRLQCSLPPHDFALFPHQMVGTATSFRHFSEKLHRTLGHPRHAARGRGLPSCQCCPHCSHLPHQYARGVLSSDWNMGDHSLIAPHRVLPTPCTRLMLPTFQHFASKFW